MKKNELIGKLFLFLTLGMLMAFVSCQKDDDDPKPVADFTFEVNDLEATFTNLSTDAETYAWDFGDGGTSSAESPVYTFSSYGTFTVTLTATGPGGTSTVTYDVTLVSLEPVVIDGSFDDWADVDNLYNYPDGEGRTLLQAKVTNSDQFIYFYLKGTSNLGEIIQLFIDADNDGATGWDYWSFYETPGLDYLMEAVIVAFDGTDPSSSLLSATGPVDWPWESFIASNALYELSDYITDGDNKVIEFSMLMEAFTIPALGNTVRFVFGNSDNSWANVGHLPPSSTDPLTAPVEYTMQ